MKFSEDSFESGGEKVKENETYTVTDIKKLENLVVSMTVLHPGKNTSGHSHEDAEEVYFFRKGRGIMQLNESNFDVSGGDIILIPKGSFHKVFNKGKDDLVFVCVFEKYGERK